MAIINYREWVFDCDVQATKEAYGKINVGSAGECMCDYCANFAAQRGNTYPQEILTLFEQLGIDYTKENYVHQLATIENSEHHLYMGVIYFIGSSLEQPAKESKETKFRDSIINFSEGRLSYPMSEDVFDRSNIVAIEFEAKLPWVIDKPEWD